jgi:transposase
MQEAEASAAPCVACAATGAWMLEIVKRADAHHSVVLPKRWVAERAFARIGEIGASPATSSATPGALRPSAVLP